MGGEAGAKVEQTWEGHVGTSERLEIVSGAKKKLRAATVAARKLFSISAMSAMRIPIVFKNTRMGRRNWT